jgi:hypothetical protein
MHVTAKKKYSGQNRSYLAVTILAFAGFQVWILSAQLQIMYPQDATLEIRYLVARALLQRQVLAQAKWQKIRNQSITEHSAKSRCLLPKDESLG